MGTHARPRRRVRTAALGTLAVGATLTGVGLTAAALDPSGAGLADGTLSSEPVNFAASGLGAPVPVAGVSALDGSSSVGKGVLVTGGGSGTNGAPAVEAPATGYDVAQVKPVKQIVAATEKSAKTASASRVTPASNTASTIRTVVGSNSASGNSASGNSAPGTSASAANAAPKTGAASGGSSAGGTSTSTPQLPSLDASLPVSTALPVPSLPTLPTISNLSTTVSHAKTTLAGLLNEVAGLV